MTNPLVGAMARVRPIWQLYCEALCLIAGAGAVALVLGWSSELYPVPGGWVMLAAILAMVAAIAGLAAGLRDCLQTAFAASRLLLDVAAVGFVWGLVWWAMAGAAFIGPLVLLALTLTLVALMPLRRATRLVLVLSADNDLSVP